MKRGNPSAVLSLALPCALLALWAAGSSAAQTGGGRAVERAPSPEEIRALVGRVIANQHRDDAALAEYERTERRQIRKSGQAAAPVEDKTFRVVPTGTGVVRVQVEDNGRPVDAELYRRQLRDVEQALVSALRPNEPRQHRAVEKGAKRSRERTEMVDTVAQAFRFTWLGRETRNGRLLAKLALDPHPAYRPTSSNTKLFAHARATLWLDEAAGQLVRVEAEVIRDISFGGGVFGKVYRGGRFVFEQAEVAPGVWLPTRYEYDFGGRKFLFGFEVHELTEASRYRRIGPPADALVAIRRELGAGGSSDP
ncbi:MAG: hypothetical protein HY237_01775 [Acidobacteria bacterium]|nr:hypothetical protein [Acidobacteriota bacterium]